MLEERQVTFGPAAGRRVGFVGAAAAGLRGIGRRGGFRRGRAQHGENIPRGTGELSRCLLGKAGKAALFAQDIQLRQLHRSGIRGPHFLLDRPGKRSGTECHGSQRRAQQHLCSKQIVGLRFSVALWHGLLHCLLLTLFLRAHILPHGFHLPAGRYVQRQINMRLFVVKIYFKFYLTLILFMLY